MRVPAPGGLDDGADPHLFSSRACLRSRADVAATALPVGDAGTEREHVDEVLPAEQEPAHRLQEQA